MSDPIVLPYQFDPRGYQREIFEAHEQGYNRFLLIWHRRAGKDKTCINFCAHAALTRVGTYYYILPTYAQGKKIIWDGMDGSGYRFLHHFPPALWEGRPNQNEMKLRLTNGSLFQVIGSDNIDSIMGTNPVGVVFSEFSLQDPAAWDFIRPILRENGGWALFNGTPRGRQNHLYKLYMMSQGNDSWFTTLKTIDDTGVMTDADVQEEIASGMEYELAQQEFYCSFDVGQAGSFYGKLMQEMLENGRVCDVPYDPNLPVDTWWDLGMHDSAAITFVQQVPGSREIRIIDYFEQSGEGLSYYIRHLAGLPYVYGEHIAPHDIAVRELGTGKSRLETAASLGLRFKVARRLSLEDGINAVRMMLPMVWMDKTKCARLTDALQSYHKKWDKTRREWTSKPDHDWSSHGADSVRTGAVGRKNPYLPEKSDRYRNEYLRPRRKSWMTA